jgi:hypothetical protein
MMICLSYINTTDPGAEKYAQLTHLKTKRKVKYFNMFNPGRQGNKKTLVVIPQCL